MINNIDFMNYNLINGKAISNEELEQFSNSNEKYFLKVFYEKPETIFKFFPNTLTFNKEINKDINYSQLALKTNDIYLSNPSNFNDPYDCGIYINREKHWNYFINYYARLMGIENKDNSKELLIEKLKKFFDKTLDIETSINFNYCHTEEERLRLSIFIYKVRNYSFEKVPVPDKICYGILKALNDDFLEKKNNLTDKFLVSCLTTEKDNILMWSHYANNHKGFCIEYDLSEAKNNYLKLNEEEKNTFNNLFPVVYSENRKEIINYNFNGDTFLSWYLLGLLRKYHVWSYEKEWRLALLKQEYPDQIIKFFPIKAVYCGCKMSKEEIEKIEEIIREKNIDLFISKIEEDSYKLKFELNKDAKFN